MSLLQRCTRGVVALLTLSLAFFATEAGAGSVSYLATYPLTRDPAAFADVAR